MFTLAYSDRQSSVQISGCYYIAVFLEDEDRGSAFDQILSVPDALDQIVLVGDQGCHQLSLVDLSSCFCFEMSMSVAQDMVYHLVAVVDYSYC